MAEGVRVKLREWLDRQVAIADARAEGGGQTVDLAMEALASVVVAVKILDQRLERLELEAGLQAFDITT